ncbi:MAG: hypothetical protein ACPLRW_08850 [Moorellales bacterium]
MASDPVLVEERDVLRRVYGEVLSAAESAGRTAREAWEEARGLMNEPERREDFHWLAARSDRARDVQRSLAASIDPTPEGGGLRARFPRLRLSGAGLWACRATA